MGFLQLVIFLPQPVHCSMPLTVMMVASGLQGSKCQDGPSLNVSSAWNSGVFIRQVLYPNYSHSSGNSETCRYRQESQHPHAVQEASYRSKVAPWYTLLRYPSLPGHGAGVGAGVVACATSTTFGAS